MRIGDLSGPAAKLELAIDSLRTARQEIAAAWNDPTYAAFHERVFVPLEAKYRRAADAIRRMAQVLEKAERECGDS
jgi:malonyl CoA-acyl carrier protein transacylase